MNGQSPGIKRIWHHYSEWEEIAAGMWKLVKSSERDKLLRAAIKFTGDADLYGAAMLRVTKEWPKSCEHNLTDYSQNRKAWIGHAAACLVLGCPEHVTREAWGHLSEEQRDRANAKAVEAILSWENARSGQARLFPR